MFNPFKKKPFEIDDFAKLVITEAKKAGIAGSLEYDPKSFVLWRGRGAEQLGIAGCSIEGEDPAFLALFAGKTPGGEKLKQLVGAVDQVNLHGGRSQIGITQAQCCNL
jgi:hypothetical protein